MKRWIVGLVVVVAGGVGQAVGSVYTPLYFPGYPQEHPHAVDVASSWNRVGPAAILVLGFKPPPSEHQRAACGGD